MNEFVCHSESRYSHRKFDECSTRADVAQIDGARPASARVVYDGVAARGTPAFSLSMTPSFFASAGKLRGAYRGVVAFRRGPTTVFLAPHMEQIRAYMGGADYARV